MTTHQKLEAPVAALDFRKAFVEVLNWNHPTARPLSKIVQGRTFTFTPIAETGGFEVFEVAEKDRPADAASITAPGSRSLRAALDGQITAVAHSHILIFLDREEQEAVFVLASNQDGKRRLRERPWRPGRPVAPLLAFLAELNIDWDMLDPDGDVPHTRMLEHLEKGSATAEKVSKKFYTDLAAKRKAFEPFLQWITDEQQRAWYITALLNRLMFIYFIQQKGLLKGDPHYLRNLLDESRKGGEDRFYREYFLPLCFFGFGQKPGERGRYEKQFKDILYLNGGLFALHPVEQEAGISPEAVGGGALPENITIPDAEFERWFDFFNAWRWTLDEENPDNDNEINPSILGYIFEKYVNQKQMGAYYTKEDITGYICRNTIIPRLFDMVAESGSVGKKAVDPLPIDPHPNTLNGGRGISDGEGIDRYVYPAVKTLDRLPTETDREYAARQDRYEGILQDFEDGKIRNVNDFITYNLDIEQMARDFIGKVQDAEVLRAFYFDALQKITVLDPTCGSGAFLFAALNILVPLYKACLDRMLQFQGEEGAPTATLTGEMAFVNEAGGQCALLDPDTVSDENTGLFRAELARIAEHHNRDYYIIKSIIVNNLYGVDIMEEAVEICKLRLFLKLVAQAEPDNNKPNHGIEPLPDIDFNILAGNTLVGFARPESINTLLGLYDPQEVTDVNAEMASVGIAYHRFQAAQMRDDSPSELRTLKARLVQAIEPLRDKLDHLLAGQYSQDLTLHDSTYRHWRQSHKPFHWCAEFYDVMVKHGGFDVVGGNPPYLETGEVGYTAIGLKTEATKAVHAMCIERSLTLMKECSAISMIVPLSLVSTQRMTVVQGMIERKRSAWYANFSWRPGKLFDTVNRALTIFTAVSDRDAHTYSTGYQKWSSDGRDVLIGLVDYVEVPRTRPGFWVPKISTPIERSILDKCVAGDQSVAGLVGKQGFHVYYRCGGGLYWKVFTDFPPAFRLNGHPGHSSRETTLTVREKKYLRPLIAILSSDVFWWWYTVTSNCRDLNPSDLHAFRFPRSLLDDQTLVDLADRYLDDVQRHSTMKVRVQAKTGRTETQSFKIQKSKPIIDEIDRVLAKHYGFTDEELDFIINYDIKYRMGQTSDTEVE